MRSIRDEYSKSTAFKLELVISISYAGALNANVVGCAKDDLRGIHLGEYQLSNG